MYVREWILIRIENGFQLVPIGSYRFLLMVRTVRTEVMSCQAVDKVYKTFQKRLPRIRSSVRNVFFRTYLFQNSLLHNNVFIVLVHNFIR